LNGSFGEDCGKRKSQTPMAVGSGDLLGGWSFISQNQSRENFSRTFGKYSSGINQSANPQPPQTRSRNLPLEK
jgi:hypothetical protein